MPQFHGSISAGPPVDLPDLTRFLCDRFIPDGDNIRMLYLGGGDYSRFGVPRHAVVYYDDNAAACDGCIVVAVVRGEPMHDLYRVEGGTLTDASGRQYPLVTADIFGRAISHVASVPFPSPHTPHC